MTKSEPPPKIAAASPRTQLSRNSLETLRSFGKILTALKFIISELNSAKFVTADLGYTTNKSEALIFDTEEKATTYCRKHGLLAKHVPVAIPKEQLANRSKT